MADNIASQARHYNNLSLIKRNIKAVVHLEDAEDELFWNTVLQRVRPGEYHFVHYSKSQNNHDTKGCDQCLKFRPYLTPKFFICIDSDFRYLMGEPDMDATHYVIQTYTYSWENHFCHSNTLQASVMENVEGMEFDFSLFFANLSKVLYEPLLLLLYCKRTDNTLLTEKMFRQILKTQCTAIEAQNNGIGYVNYIKQSFAPLLDGSAAIGFNANVEASIYAAKGLTQENAYLHVRGHNIYDLAVYIGKMFSRPFRIGFEADVLKKAAIGGSYWEYTEIEKDLRNLFL